MAHLRGETNRVYVGKFPYDARERDVKKFFKGFNVKDILMHEGFAFVDLSTPREAEQAVYDLCGRDLMSERVMVEFAKPSAPYTSRPFFGRVGRGYLSTRRREPEYRDYREHRDYGGDYRDSRDSFRGYSGSRRSRTWFDTGPPRGRSSRFGRSSFYSSGGRDKPKSSGGLTYAENSRYGPPRNTEYRVIVENLSSSVNWQDLKDFMRQAGEVTYADAHKRERNMGIVDFASDADMKKAIEQLNGMDLQGKKIRLVQDKSRKTSKKSHSRKSRSRSPNSSRSGSESGDRSRSQSPKEKKSRSRSRSHSRSGSESKDENDKNQDGRRSKSRTPSPMSRSPSAHRSDRSGSSN